MIVLNSYGKQYIDERMNLFPNSMYAKTYLQAFPAFSSLMDHAYFAATHDPHLFYLVNARGEIYRIQVELKQQMVQSVQLFQQSMVPMEICSVIGLSMKDSSVLFLGSLAAQSILFDVQKNAVADGTQTQNSIHNLQVITSKEKEDQFISLTHGYSPLLPTPYPSSNSQSEVRLKLPIQSESTFPLQTSSLHKFLHTVYLQDKQLLVLSNSRDTMIYSIQQNNLSLLAQESTPLRLDEVTIAIDAISTESGEVVVQVCEKRILVVRDTELVATIDKNVKIVHASFAKKSVYFYDSEQTLNCLHVTSQSPFYSLQTLLTSPANPVTSLCTFESWEFDPFVKSHSLFPAGETIEEEVLYSSTVETVETKNVPSFVLADDEELFAAGQEKQSVNEETQLNAKWREYVLLAFEDGSIRVEPLHLMNV